ncbi:MAG TPA: sensor domain-containing diguanylate cyclase [Silvibacterium sp.]|nr:sensor domain-containing diguanylate cyclase [Silvibacterium sp.]
MQSTLLDILILGLLVLVFGSIYRTRKTLRLRYWIAGWLFILAHFALLLLNPAGKLWLNVTGGLGIAALLLGGLCFLVASSPAFTKPGPALRAQVLLAAPVALFGFVAVFGFSNALMPAFLALVEYAVLSFVFRCWRQNRLILVASAICAVMAAVWAAHDMVTHQDIPGVYPVLTQIYLMNAVVYWYGFRRRSIGAVTTSAGLVAWGLVFPIAVSMAAWLPNIHVSGELWNLPKYFVEFGMILTLLEDDVIETARQREEYRVLFDGNPHPMWIFDSETLRFLKVNKAAVTQYGFSQAEFLAKTLREIRPPDEVPRLEEHLRAAGDNKLFTGPWTHIRKDGSAIKVEVDSHKIQFEGRCARFSLVQDVTERHQLYERLLFQAHHDILTGLPNRLLLKDRMEQMLAGSERHGDRAAILCIDLDHFKQVNDTYGHHVGDICLQEVAALLRDKLRVTDTIARSGGEEFIVLLGQLKNRGDAAGVAQVLIDAFRQPLLIEGHMVNLTASIGIALFPTDGTAAYELWRLADSAMYRAKHAGGNQYGFAGDENGVLQLDEMELQMGEFS